MSTQDTSLLSELPEIRVIAGMVAVSVFLGAYATWITADYIPRALTFIFVTVGVGGILYRRKREAGDDADGLVGLAYAGYVFAGLLLLTPFMMVLPDILSAGTYGRSALELLFMTMNGVLFVVFAVPAAVVAYLSYRAS